MKKSLMAGGLAFALMFSFGSVSAAPIGGSTYEGVHAYDDSNYETNTKGKNHTYKQKPMNLPH
ncbi:hypothetical protein IMZ31_23305 (plasmid) [Pontibacillus sp. ALD_SL1]|uniref:hypothetical protein n=1 Tax=Pontibacillus sp. ALD_SL1 TaxID=2777185 RepID=UPI001A96F466|nr:hypothetical protein [Pontibacillus sp. ALD_SL1]QST02380.1 hypothetical protein IMZ31_23305 [Pontibacillus sp. ALD_SL1]